MQHATLAHSRRRDLTLHQMAMALAIDLESIKRLTNLADINRALHETHAHERSIEAELEELLSKRSSIEESFVSLHDSASEVRPPVLTATVREPAHGFCWTYTSRCAVIPHSSCHDSASCRLGGGTTAQPGHVCSSGASRRQSPTGHLACIG